MTERVLSQRALNRALLARQLLLDRATLSVQDAVEQVGGLQAQYAPSVEEHRPRVFSTRNPFSVGTYLVDGRVAGAWSLRDGRIVLDPYGELGSRDHQAVEEERAALEAFHA